MDSFTILVFITAFVVYFSILAVMKHKREKKQSMCDGHCDCQ